MSEEYTKLPKMYWCCAYRLNLVSKNDTKQVLSKNQLFNGFILKLKAILHHQNKNPTGCSKVKEHLDKLFVTPVSTQLKSEFASISDCLRKTDENKNGVKSIMTYFEVSHFSNEEISCAREYCKIMGPLARALDEFQGDHTVGLGMVLPIISGLKDKLLKMSSSKSLLYCQELVDIVYKSICRRFNHHFDEKVYILAAISCPRWRAKWITNVESKEKAVLMLKEEVQKCKTETKVW